MIHWDDPVWSLLLGGGYLGLFSLQWLTLLAGVGQYGKRWRIERPATSQERLPPITVIVPARNEVGNIAACVQSILASDHKALELLVIDDQSDDGTAEAATRAAAGDPRFHLLQGRERPSGWAGKTWALSQAAGNAAHDHLLFVDADVTLAPAAVGAVLSRMEQDHLDLLSCFGTWRLESFWEHVAIPVVGWLIRGATNLDRVNDPAREEAFANGQFILVRRSAYESLGGHGAVKSEVLEDVRIARAFKQKGARTGMFYSPWAFSVRLYRSLPEIIEGYTKNLYEGMGRAPVVALGLAMFVLVGSILPFLLLFFGILAQLLLGWQILSLPWLVWLVALCACILLVRVRTALADGESPGWFWTYPLGNLILAWIALRSMFKVEVQWKGRSFKDGKADGIGGRDTP